MYSKRQSNKSYKIKEKSKDNKYITNKNSLNKIMIQNKIDKIKILLYIDNKHKIYSKLLQMKKNQIICLKIK